MKVLICDDDPVTRGYLVALVTGLGYQAIACETFASAFLLLTGPHAPRLAILDWLLPDGSGVDLCAQIRTHSDLLSTYLILLTSRSRPEDLVEGLRAGANDYVKKPFDPGELKARIAIGAKVIELQERVQALSGLLPICSWCKKIRDDNAEWVPIERYVAQHSQAQFTHGGCPECIDKARKAASAPR